MLIWLLVDRGCCPYRLTMDSPRIHSRSSVPWHFDAWHIFCGVDGLKHFWPMTSHQAEFIYLCCTHGIFRLVARRFLTWVLDCDQSLLVCCGWVPVDLMGGRELCFFLRLNDVPEGGATWARHIPMPMLTAWRYGFFPANPKYLYVMLYTLTDIYFHQAQLCFQVPVAKTKF